MISRLLAWGRSLVSLSGLGRLLIGAGVAIAVAGVLFPGLVAALFPSIATPTASSEALAALGLGCLAVAGVALWRQSTTTDPGPLTLRSPEAAQSDSIALSGRALSRRIMQAKSVQPSTLEYQPRSEAEIERRLREAAIDTYQRATGVSMDAAVDAVDTGVWTDDPVAAASLGDEAAVETPGTLWLRRRLDPKGAYELEVERTAAAIERLETND